MKLEAKWVALWVMTVGTFLVVLDSMAVTLALADIERDFGTDSGIEWVFTAYIVALGVTQLASGWISDSFGRKNAFIATLTVFTVGSGLCAMAPSLPVLVAFRVLQGLGGGLLIPVTTAMIFETFGPYERGKAMGLWGIALTVAPAVGPLVGGAIVETVGWRWVFAVNVPIGGVGALFAWRIMTASRPGGRRSLDVIGLAVASVSTSALTIGLSEAESWGWLSLPTVASLAIGLGGVAWFVIRMLRRSHPLVNVALFANRTYSLGVVTSALIMVTQMGRGLFIPLELSSTRGVADITVGFVLLPAGIGLGAFMPFGGRLTDRFGSRGPVTVGALLMGLGFALLSRLGPETDLWFIALALTIGGIGAGIGMMSPNVVAMTALRFDEVNQGAGLTSVARQIAVAVGVTGLVAVSAAVEDTPFESGDPVTQAAIDPFNAVFATCAFVMALVVVIAQWLPGPKWMRAMQDARSAEQP